MADLVDRLAAIMEGVAGHRMPTFDFWYSTSFWIYVLWGLCLSAKPTFTHEDVTVVIPTIHNMFEELRPSLESILACEPAALILVTTHDRRKGLELMAESLPHFKVKVLSIQTANKRLQVCEALPNVKTAITIMADDDVT
ncbi:hypothetical protein TOPH_02405 [Tolypocladium ophioglossoides CBS 100239]|uniref:Uncharacterized protein n=1 Tax=Tolypocladium ophioglossoides (strain CBS 100239) TaxID=1163406 RepID=A0A0L0NFL7_TOLOC|nr:hypothetical protein TOPH_02405 [Tolypocladium ophioglossoides CBS 100239]